MADYHLASAIRRRNQSYLLRDNYLMRRRLVQTVEKLKPKLEPTHRELFSPQISLPAMRNKSEFSSLTSDEGRKTIKEAWDLVEEAKNNVIFDPNYRDAVLMVGNTGTGKSTLIQFIASDMSKMSAIEHPDGSGNYVIIDEDGKISKPGEEVVSKTLYPELVVNTTQEVAYYDCPGFKDSRGTATDLAGTYMTKMVFENLASIKIHITVEWETAIGANGRGVPFIEAIERVGEFIREAEKFKDGFSMVATKVPKVTRENEEGNDIVVPDDILIKSIGDFIANSMMPEVKRKIESEKNEKKKKIQENALVIFTSLSKLTDGSYSRVGLFRKPQKMGSLEKSLLMQKSRNGIISAIRKETDYMVVSTDDFGMSIADKTKLEMKGIANELNADILKNMKEMSASISAHVANRIRASEDWADLIVSLTEILLVVSDNAKQLKELEKFTTDFVNDMQSDFTAVDIEISSLKYQALKDDISYLDFVEAMLEENVGAVPQTAFDDSVTLINQSVAWYKIMYQVLDALSDYSIQKDTTKYNVADLNDWGATGRPQGLHVSAEKFQQFAKLLKVDTLAINGFNLNEERMNELNSVIKLTLATNAIIKINLDGTLLARGPFVLLSKVFEVYKKNEKSVKVVNIHALCTAYIDTPTFTAPGCHTVIAAPKWHVIDKTTINLDGKTGGGFSRTIKPGPGSNPAAKGNPGLPGQPAGHFLGVAEDVVNAKQLTISAHGGKGGIGQDGGRGSDGFDGYNAKMPWYNGQRTPDGDYVTIWSRETNRFTYILYEDQFQIKNGRVGTSGINGGDGGIRGHGSSGGKVKLFIFAGAQNGPKVQVSEGRDGNDGDGGDGGNGGRNGNELMAYYWCMRPGNDGGWSLLETLNKGYANRGNRGRKGGNEAGHKPAIPQMPSSDMNAFLIDFKGYILEMSTKLPVLRQSLEQLLRKMNETSDFTKLYNALTTLADSLKPVQETSLREMDVVDNEQLKDIQDLITRVEETSKLD